MAPSSSCSWTIPKPNRPTPRGRRSTWAGTPLPTAGGRIERGCGWPPRRSPRGTSARSRRPRRGRRREAGWAVGEVRVTLEGIKTLGRHGANPGERDQPQEFLVDLEILTAVVEDDIDAVIDYRTLASTVRDVVAGTSYHLVEILADAVARAVFELPLITEVTATVHKPSAADALDADD